MKDNVLICPICSCELLKSVKDYHCSKTHCFDIAKEGYVNLLLVNQKKSKSPGDDKTMSNARFNFLKQGFFEELRFFIEDLINKNLKENSYILDAGCGPGYYLEDLNKSKYNIYGVDISKDAIKIASKNIKDVTFLVSSIFKLPFKNNSFDCILNIFAPKPNAEFKRLLKNNGIVIEVAPGKDHLIELKHLLYSHDKERISEYKQFDISLENQFEIKYNKKLCEQQIISLIEMTPFIYKTDKKLISNLKDVTDLEVTFNFVIKLWRKNGF